MQEAREIIKILSLKPLPGEGGYYRETYRSASKLPKEMLTDSYVSGKHLCTAIFYLLTPDTFSNLHRLPTDEIYHFYLGDPVTMLLLYPDWTGKIITLGQDIKKGHSLQLVVPGGVWQGSFLAEGGKYALMGTTMSPGFDFSDYEPGLRSFLIEKYIEYKDIIIKLTKE